MFINSSFHLHTARLHFFPKDLNLMKDRRIDQNSEQLNRSSICLCYSIPTDILCRICFVYPCFKNKYLKLVLDDYSFLLLHSKLPQTQHLATLIYYLPFPKGQNLARFSWVPCSESHLGEVKVLAGCTLIWKLNQGN